MPIDYVSTIPWNDPVNPWPGYTQYVLSASNIPVITVDMNGVNGKFNPLQADDPSVAYVNGAGYYLYGVNDEFGALWTWQIIIPGSGAPYYTSYTLIKDPARVVFTQGRVIITPVLSAVAPWEQRRRRLLEIV